MKQIIFFGDSLTAGYGLRSASTESFPAILQQKINQSGFPYQIINAGISGDTTQSALYRLENVLRSPATIFILALGANDMLRSHSPAATAANLEKIILRVKETNPEVKLALLGMELPGWITQARAEPYRKLYRSLSEKYGMSYLPFLLEGVAGKPELNIPDGLHPNAAGYQIIAERVWPLLHSMLEIPGEQV
ncbi:arylesterase [Pedobacter sp. ASV1-7]|uniref:arylesterase n=1 Tax=Pedobacter sp. ASV1-7 TaxID=3145237 RepID=UPI0032E8C2C4